MTRAQMTVVYPACGCVRQHERGGTRYYNTRRCSTHTERVGVYERRRP